MTSRRALLKSLPACGMAAIVPSAAGAAEPEHPWVKARRLARELSATLAECDEGTMMAEVYPASSGRRSPFMFIDAEWRQFTAQDRLKYHAQAYGRAAKEIDPTATELWMGTGVGDNPQRFSLIVAQNRKSS